MYQIFDLLIESNIPLPELPEVADGLPAISFRLSTAEQENEQFDWLHHWRLPNGEITISCAKVNGDYYLRFPDLADFKIEDGCIGILCYPRSGVSDDMIRHLLLDQVIPRVASHYGETVLHASAIMVDGHAIAFIGDTGWGKSTLAASFHVNGYSLLTDDCLLLRQDHDTILAIPAYASARLWEDSYDAMMNKKNTESVSTPYSSKKQITLDENESVFGGGFLLSAIFVLTSKDQSMMADNIINEKISGAEIIINLTQHSFVLDVTDINKMKEKFFSLGQTAISGVTFHKLTYPHRHDLLDEVRDSVIKVLSG